MEKNKVQNLYLIGSFLILCLLLSLAANFRLLLSSRASSSSNNTSNFSIMNSYASLSPLEAKADGSERIRLVVFLLNDLGYGVSGVKVQLEKSNELVLNTVQNTTDSYGRAIFDLTSKTTGEYFVQATVSGVSVGQNLKLKFN